MSDSFDDLVALMAHLRSAAGCPWDREQTFETLAPMLVEEAYEVFEAAQVASEGRTENLRDELGDLLFQILFYAQIASERNEFTIDDVARAVHAKMVRRHPHVFGDAQAETSPEVLRNWEEIKAVEKRAAGDAERQDKSLLNEISLKTPALVEARKLSSRAARVGFDWKQLEDIFDKLHEEIEELRGAIRERDESSSGEASETRVNEEIGDVLFAVANIARHLKVEPESALKLTNRKFRRRFRHIERKLMEQGRTLEDATLDEMEALWQEAKKQVTSDE
ncbi:MAG: nucleoside triphosphate pyrophosphohydrolase [Acidobacteria bacterium 13_1_20CM_3_53_8]|nr:MAG: nucleoside triphosphate pyrophosphohydrolase [Acidobacteria bacterium 13_1_20CM_3_53_8]